MVIMIILCIYDWSKFLPKKLIQGMYPLDAGGKLLHVVMQGVWLVTICSEKVVVLVKCMKQGLPVFRAQGK